MTDFIGLFLIIIIAVLLVFYIKSLRRMEERNLRLQENINLARHFFDEVQEHADSIRHYRHDLNKHMRILEEFLEKGKKFDHSEEYRELSCSYQRMQKDAAAMYQNAYCDNEIINAICEINQRECQKRDIIFETDISGDENAWKKLDWISEYHLTGILMNLLDNAREAQLRLEPGERKFIFLLVHLTPASDMTPEHLNIAVSNTVPGGAKPDFHTGKADKDRHGLGLDIAEKYCGIYHGCLSFQHDPERHCLTVAATLIGS